MSARVLDRGLPSRISHSKLDAAILAALGVHVPYVCRWNESRELIAIEYQIPEGSEFSVKDVDAVLKSHRLEEGEKDHFEEVDTAPAEEAPPTKSDIEELREQQNQFLVRLQAFENLLGRQR